MQIPSGGGKKHGDIRSSEDSAKWQRVTTPPKSGLSVGRN